MGLRLREQQICGDRKQKGSCQGLKANGYQELVFQGSEISLQEPEAPEMDGGYLLSYGSETCGDGFGAQ